MSERVHHFDAALKRIIVPPLGQLGFITNRRLRDLRRKRSADGRHFTQIVSFQIGNKRMIGRFTVNLGVYCEGESSLQVSTGRYRQAEVVDCYYEMTKRLGFLFDPPQGVFAKLFGAKAPVPFDYWWRFDEGQAGIERNLTEVRDCILGRGVPWLDEIATADAVVKAKTELESRKRVIAAELTARRDGLRF